MRPHGRSRARLVSCQGMKVFFMVVAAVYILYLLFLIVRACSELGHMPYVGECWSPTPGAGPPARSGRRAPSGRGQRGEPRQVCWRDWATWTVPQARVEGSPVGRRSAGAPGGRVCGYWSCLDPSGTHLPSKAVGVGVSFSLNRGKSPDLIGSCPPVCGNQTVMATDPSRLGEVGQRVFLGVRC